MLVVNNTQRYITAVMRSEKRLFVKQENSSPELLWKNDIWKFLLNELEVYILVIREDHTKSFFVLVIPTIHICQDITNILNRNFIKQTQTQNSQKKSPWSVLKCWKQLFNNFAQRYSEKFREKNRSSIVMECLVYIIS